MKVLAYLSLAIVFSAAAGVAAPKKTIKKTKMTTEKTTQTVVSTKKTHATPVAAPVVTPPSENPTVGESSAAVTATQLETVAAAPTDAKLTGGVEIRPGYVNDKAKAISENWGALGYQFNRNLEVGYLQYFNTNLYTPSDAKTNGLGLSVEDGFAKVRMSNIWNNNSGLSLSYEPRVYLPTNPDRRNQGMITVIRNYLRLTQQFNSTVSVSLFDIPMIHAYNTRGSITPKGEFKANPAFENRVYLITDINITDKLSVSIPLLYEAKRNRNFNGQLAVRNDAWAHNFYVWPEVNYQATPNMAVGVAYYSENLLGGNDNDPLLKNGYRMTASTIGTGFKNGVTQLILRASL